VLISYELFKEFFQVLDKIAGSIGSFIGAVAPSLVLNIMDFVVKNDSSQKQLFLDSFFTGMATSIKKEIVSQNKVDPSFIAFIIAVREIDFRKRSPKSLWYTWTETDLYDFLLNKVGISAEIAQKITELYMSLIYDVMNSSLNGEIDLDHLSVQLMSNPEFMKYQNT
jgi:hypothetical protein